MDILNELELMMLFVG